jgi:hypothetical protein
VAFPAKRRRGRHADALQAERVGNRWVVKARAWAGAAGRPHGSMGAPEGPSGMGLPAGHPRYPGVFGTDQEIGDTSRRGRRDGSRCRGSIATCSWSGPGPAGSVAALPAGRSRMPCNPHRRWSFPAEKACGGGVQQRALSHIPVDAGDYSNPAEKTDFSSPLGIDSYGVQVAAGLWCMRHTNSTNSCSRGRRAWG